MTTNEVVVVEEVSSLSSNESREHHERSMSTELMHEANDNLECFGYTVLRAHRM